MADTVIPEKHIPKQLARFSWPKGVSGNPNGRPKGKTLKEFAREYLESLSPEDKIEYLATLPPEIVWRMAEGNPSEDKKVTISVPRPILGGISQDALPQAQENEQIRDAVAHEALAEAVDASDTTTHNEA